MKNRKRNRKKGFDYSSENIYFITICCKHRLLQFGKVVQQQMQLNVFGEIVEKQIEWLHDTYPYFELHNAVVMPNHIHLLFEINTRLTENDIKIKTVSELMGALKTTSSKQIHLFGNMEFEWQRSFHDHIVRNADSYDSIYGYISENPERWEDDIHNCREEE